MSNLAFHASIPASSSDAAVAQFEAERRAAIEAEGEAKLCDAEFSRDGDMLTITWQAKQGNAGLVVPSTSAPKQLYHPNGHVIVAHRD